MQHRQVKVMVVDDSAFMRKFLSEVINSDPELHLVGTARNGEDALKKISSLRPDVITLDVEMPKLNGVDTLKRIMKVNPLPVIMVSSFTSRGSEITMEALSLGAVDFVTKPTLFNSQKGEELKQLLPVKIKHAAGARLYSEKTLTASQDYPKIESVPLQERKAAAGLNSRVARSMVAIGSSTGGPRALEELLRDIPGDLPAAVFITQHMPAGFTSSLAKRLDKISMLKVKEAAGGEKIMEGEAYLAPGGSHLTVNNNGIVVLSTSAPVNHVRPSVDVMMNSVVEVFGQATLGVILTGMGRDGSDGMAKIKEKGGKTIAQDPSTAVIPSMPQAVIKRGLADKVIPLNEIAKTIVSMIP